MQFRTSPVNRITRVVAALLLMSIGGLFLVGNGLVGSLFALVPVGAGLGILLLEAWRAGQEWRNRPDPYDLSLLKDLPSYQGPSRDNPLHKEDASTHEAEGANTVYCHRCDVSMPAHYDICPRCGNFLGK